MRRLPPRALTRRRGEPRLRLLAAVVGAGLFSSASASAHHAPGHGPSESVRTLNGFAGRTPRALQRALLLGEIVRNTAQPNLNAATIYTLSALVSVRPHPWLSVGLQAPYTFVDEDAPGVPTKSGYGDTRLELRLTPHADKLLHRVLTVGVNASFPTRTVRFQADPGPMWSVAPLVAYTRSYEFWSWQAVLLAPLEHRPAGTAFEGSGAFVVNHRLLPSWSWSVGALVDVRIASSCALPGGGQTWCRDGRVTELSRETGATRGYVTAGTGVELAEDWAVSASVQAPVTHRRDFDLAGSIGLEGRF